VQCRELVLSELCYLITPKKKKFRDLIPILILFLYWWVKGFSAIFSMQICGEHKESGILRHGFFASPFSHDVGRPVEVEHEIKGHKGGYNDRIFGLFDMVIIDLQMFLVRNLMYEASYFLAANLIINAIGFLEVI
jgi:hypothetical protein